MPRNLLRFSAVLLVIALLVIAELWVSLPLVSPIYTLSSDLATYFTVAVHSQDPTLFSQDLLYGSGTFSQTIQWSSWLYLQILYALYRLTGEQVTAALIIFNAGLFGIGAAGMMGLLYRLFRQPLFAIIVGIISMSSSFAALGPINWGLPANLLTLHRFRLIPSVVPEFMYIALTPWLLWVVVHFWLLPGLTQQKIKVRWVFILGLIVGLTPALINSTSGLGFIAFSVTLAGVAFLFRRVSLISLMAYLLGILPVLGLRFFAGVGVAAPISLETAHILITVGRSAMIFPWASAPADQIPVLEAHWVTFFGVYLGITALSGIAAWWTNNRVWKLAVWLTQSVLFLTLLQMGWVPIVLGLYGMYRVSTKRDTGLDYALLAAVPVSILIGYVAQIGLFFLWQATQNTSIVSYLYETARFSRYMLMIPYLLLAHMLVGLVMRFPLPWRSLIGALLCLLWVLNIGQSLTPTLTTLSLAAAVVFLIIADFSLHMKHPPQFLLTLTTPAVVGLLIGGISIMGVIATQRQQPYIEIGQDPLSADYSAITEWARKNTPPDSRFHLTDMNNSFRFMAQRSLLIGNHDVTRGIYSDVTPQTLQQITIEASIAHEGGGLTGFAARYAVDYVVQPVTLAPMLPAIYDAVWYAPELVYQNAQFRVYQVVRAEWLADQLYPLAAADLAALNAFTPDFALETDALVFNPIAGDIFNNVGIENWLPAYGLQAGHAAADVFTLTRLVQQMQSATELDAEISQKWLRNYLPGDLKAADMAYVFITQHWLDEAGAYVQALFADDRYYQWVRSVPGLINTELYQLYAVVGNATETQLPPTPADSVPLPIEIPADAPLFISAPTAWRGQQFFAEVSTNRVCTPEKAAPDCPLFTLWLPEALQNETTPIPPEMMHYGLPDSAVLTEFLRDNATAFVISSQDVAHETQRLLMALKHNGYTANGGTPLSFDLYPGLAWTLYQLQRTPSTLETLAQFGTEPIRLTHVALQTPESVAPCAVLRLQTWWEHDVVPTQNYFITLRLVSAANDIIAQSDGRIGEHRLPDLPAATPYFDERSLTVPCDALPGQYQLQAGLYSYEDGIFSDLLPVTDAAGNALGGIAILDGIEVAR